MRMEKTSPSSGIYSHPGVLLEDHLTSVANFLQQFLQEKEISFNKEISQVCRVIGLVHDLGKATGYFQDYLRASTEKKQIKRTSETTHSLFSAVCAYYLTRELRLTGERYPLFAFLVIRRHHSDLQDARDDVVFDKNDADLLLRQLESIPEDGFSVLSQKIFSTGAPLQLHKPLVKKWIEHFPSDARELRRMLRRNQGTVLDYLTLNFLYSLLLDADKSAVVIKSGDVFSRPEFNGTEWVDNYRKKARFIFSPLNRLREKAYEEILAYDIDPNEKVYSLNIPTGLGKTLLSFTFALKLRNLISSKYEVAPRIIYALPYLSIIDQNAKVVESVIKTNNLEPNTDLFLKHHHLSELFYKTEEEKYESDQAEILIEGWNSEIIITTFVQLFHTLVSNRNRSLRKFHRFANAIIILDEVQTIPVKYWFLLHDTLKALAEHLNTYIIFVTATEPLIFEKEEINSLIKNRTEYFQAVDRVVVKPLVAQSMTLNALVEYFNLDDNRRYLFILNTISSAKQFYNLLKERGIKGTYLSTHLIPKERLRRINEIKSGKHRIAVTTQLVEAGVDIDFDVVVRDIAPLDSVNQAAGRCNRNAFTKGEVYVVKLISEQGKTYTSYIYDPVLINITEGILAGKSEIRESEFLQLNDRYYQETKDRKSQQESRALREAILNLRYDTEEEKPKISEFRLIDEDHLKFDVFIEIDEQAAKIWERYLSLGAIPDPFERRKAFNMIKPKFYQYVVSIPKNIKNRPEMLGEIGYVNRKCLADYYNCETGFIINENKSVVIW